MINIDKLRQFYKFGKNLSLSDIEVLIRSAKSISFRRKQMLIEEGDRQNKIFYIRKGLVRIIYVNDKGEELTFRLIAEHHVVANVDLILYDQPSRFYYEAFEDTDTYSLDYDTVQRIISMNPKLEANRKFVFHKLLKESHTRIESFVLLNAEERYLKFLADNPGLINRVPDKYIAHVLGITPVSLSRIRKRISKRKRK